MTDTRSTNKSTTQIARPRVVQLPEDLANQIAAGEVVERPASVVKELVENAIDAGASRIRVELTDGGLKAIRVVDDGHGMTRADAELSIQRHATSKIRERADLFRISTLGFRGEALPSIASVSRFTIVTRDDSTRVGTRLTIEGGHLLESADAGCAIGSEVSVRDLFFNTPARLKFLKTKGTELKHSLQFLQRIALPNPGIGFTVTHNGRTVLDLPPVDTMGDRIFSILGAEAAEQMFPAEVQVRGSVSAHGYFAVPGFTRRTGDGVWTFVNGRYVRDRTVHSAIRVAYQGLLDRGRHPVVVMFIEVDPAEVDVNVHPSKTEVRFDQASDVFRAVRRSISDGLAASPWVDQLLQSRRDTEGGEGSDPTPAGEGRSPERATDLWVPATQPTLPSASQTYRLRGPNRQPGDAVPLHGGRQWSANIAQPMADEAMVPPTGYFTSLHYLGQFRGTYLLTSDGDAMVVVDQHAAHERITYEKLRISWKTRRFQQQPLLIPQVLRLSVTQAAILSDSLSFFQGLGFEIEPFGGNDFALKAVPAVLVGAAYQKLLHDAVDELGDDGHSNRIDEAIEAILVRMACHGSVRAGDVLGREQADALFEQMDAIDFGANCPHGRPVYFRMQLHEIERRFERR